MKPVEYRFKYRHTEHNQRAFEFDLSEFNLQLKRKEHNGELTIHDNQIETATKIREYFDVRSTLAVSVIAPCQSGKTGTMIALAGELMKHHEIPLENIFIITGHSSISWEQQTRDRFPICLRNRVYHRTKLTNKFQLDVWDKKNVLIIIDEMHIAAGDKKTVYDVFKNLGYMDSKNLYENDIKIAEFSATPDGVIVSRMKQWSKYEHKTVKGNPGPGYTSHVDYLESGRMLQSEDLSGYTKNKDSFVRKKAIQNVINLIIKIRETFGSGNRYHIIRMPQLKDAQDMLKENILNCADNGFDTMSYDEKSREDIPCINKLLGTEPSKHTFIFVKEMLRCSDTIEKKFLGVVYERYSESPSSESTQIQGLAGRVCGYDVPSDIIVYVNIPSVEKYIKLYEGNFEDIEKMKWRSITTGKGTYADNENYSSSSKSSDNIEIGYRLFDDNERHTSLPKFCKEQLKWKPKADAGYKINALKDHASDQIIARKWGLDNNITRRVVRGKDGKWVVYWLKEKFPEVPSDE